MAPEHRRKINKKLTELTRGTPIVTMGETGMSALCLPVSTNMMEITRFKFIVSTWSVENMPILKSEMRFRMISKIEVGRAEILQFLMIQARERTLAQQTASFCILSFIMFHVFSFLSWNSQPTNMFRWKIQRWKLYFTLLLWSLYWLLIWEVEIDGLLTGLPWWSRPMWAW